MTKKELRKLLKINIGIEPEIFNDTIYLNIYYKGIGICMFETYVTEEGHIIGGKLLNFIVKILVNNHEYEEFWCYGKKVTPSEIVEEILKMERGEGKGEGPKKN